MITMMLQARIFTFFFSLVVCIDAQGYLSLPRSRNYVAYKYGALSGGNSSTPIKEYCPHCLDRGGSLGQCGVVENRNYDRPRNAKGGALVPTIQATYTQGSQITVEVVLTGIHKGHFEISACPVGLGGVPTAKCFQNYRLTFVKDLLYGAPKDPHYPHRAYVAPAGYNKLVHVEHGVPGVLYRFRYQLPSNLVGQRVLIQWHYLTGNSCVYPGYSEYNWPSDWPASSTGLGVCPNIPSDGSGIPEQLWNCADVRIVSKSAPHYTPHSSSTPRHPTAKPVPSPVKPTGGYGH